MTFDLRSLDAVDAPDQWDDIVTRAADGSTDGLTVAPEPTGGARPRLLAVAAVLLVVAALAAALVLRPGDSGRLDDPAAIWGHRWQLVRLDVAGGTVDEQLQTIHGDPVVLDATSEGRLVTEVCNRFTVDADLQGDQLRFDPPGPPAIHCPDELDDLLALLFTSSATVEVDGSRLVLRTPEAPWHRILEPAPDPFLPPQASYAFVRSDAVPPGDSSGPSDPVPDGFFGHRWAMVQALDDGVRLAQPRDYEIVAAADPDTFEAPGCDHVHGPASIDADRILTVDVAEPGPLADCYFGKQVNWDEWFRALLAARPEIAVTGQRALIAAPGKQVLLVRLD
jgi:heat shock protein HslJ